MNDIQNNQTNGAVENSNAVINTKRGRPLNPNKTRKIYLTKSVQNEIATYSVRGKGAPKPGSETYFTVVQRNTKSKDFVFNAETMAVETETVKARTYKEKASKGVSTAVTETMIPGMHESATGAQVTQTETDIVVNSLEETQAVVA